MSDELELFVVSVTLSRERRRKSNKIVSVLRFLDALSEEHATGYIFNKLKEEYPKFTIRIIIVFPMSELKTEDTPAEE